MLEIRLRVRLDLQPGLVNSEVKLLMHTYTYMYVAVGILGCQKSEF